MTIEFNLSDYLVKTEGNKGYYVCEEKLKEFIRLLKEETKEWMLIAEFDGWCRTIDKLAGSKLSGEKLT